MFSSFHHLFSKEYADSIAALNATDRSELLLPTEFIVSTVLPTMLAVAASLYVLHLLFFVIVADRILACKDNDETKQQPHKRQKLKLCYQLTNGCMNLALGLGGTYYQCFIVPDLAQITSVADLVAGHDDYIYFAAAQLGYQLYSIPLGLIVGESYPMLIHHVTVIVVSTMSAACRNGFRYYTPFFYGLIEMSSVPLSIMNLMRDHQLGLQSAFYQQVRVVFAVMFLYIRVYLFTPREIAYGLQSWWLWTRSPYWEYRVFMCCAWVSSQTLLLLQLYWGMLISKGLIKLVVAKKKVKSQ